MKHLILRLLGFLIALTVAGICYWFGRKVPFSIQWPLYEALRTTASIIFAVVGAWLAIIYPERLRMSLRGNDKNNDSNGSGIGTLLFPAVHSTCILSIILLVGLIAPLLKQSVYMAQHIETCRGLSYSLVGILTVWQVWTVVLTLVPANAVKVHADAESRRKSLIQGLKRTATQSTDNSPIP